MTQFPVGTSGYSYKEWKGRFYPEKLRWAYLRLRREKYASRALTKWIDAVRAAGFMKAYVFFKHEVTGSGPRLAKRFVELAAK